MNGHDDYESMELDKRKRLLSSFEGFVRKVPFLYKVFVYKRSEVNDSSIFISRFKRDLVIFLTDNLSYFQSFDKVKIYYDNGQQMVTSALHDAIDYMLSKSAVLYRIANPQEYRLFQAVDYLCTLELTDLKYCEKQLTETDIKIFGKDYQAFTQTNKAKGAISSFVSRQFLSSTKAITHTRLAPLEHGLLQYWRNCYQQHKLQGK